MRHQEAPPGFTLTRSSTLAFLLSDSTGARLSLVTFLQPDQITPAVTRRKQHEGNGRLEEQEGRGREIEQTCAAQEREREDFNSTARREGLRSMEEGERCLSNSLGLFLCLAACCVCGGISSGAGTDFGENWDDMDSAEEGEVDSDNAMEHMNGAEGEDITADESASGAIPVTDCLFCTHHSRSLIKNIAHMTRVHSFFIPDIEYLQDLYGLFRYLGDKVGVGKICLWCNEKGKSFYSIESVKAHMNDKSHCKLFTDGDAALEFADFYDFRSSYPDHKEGEDIEMTEKEGSDKTLKYNDDTMEMILPSGSRIGHRSLMRYYKQKFGVSRQVVVSKNQKAVGRLLQQYKALGWTGGTGSVIQRGRDMQYVQRMKSKWMLKTGMSNNATKLMHYRPQVRF